MKKATKCKKSHCHWFDGYACHRNCTSYCGIDPEYVDDRVAVHKTSYGSTETVYFNREDAEKVQLRLRRDMIKSVYDNLQSALANYNDKIDKYFNKPVSTPVSIEFYEKQR